MIIAIDTAMTTIVIENRDGQWRIPYYGPRLRNAADILEIEGGAKRWHGDTKHPAYAAFGQQLLCMDVDKFGGLAVKHADGVITTELVADADCPKEIEDCDGVRHVILKHRDRVYPFFVEQHFRADKVSDVIETWIEIRHEESGPVELARMDSFALDLPRVARSYRLLTLSSWWGSEGKLSEADLARSQTITVNSRNGVRGAWDANPSFMLQLDGSATETSGRVFGGVLGWGGAWRMSFKRDWGDIVQICAGPDNGAGAYRLAPGKTLKTPDFMFTWSENGRGDISRNFHRWARTRRLPHGTGLRDVLLNSWEGSYLTFNEKTLTDMMDGVKEMGGEMFVLDDGWFGEGDFARDHDVKPGKDGGLEGGKCDAGLGDWQVNRRKLPHGIDYLISETEKRGLKFGLWYEPEMVNLNSLLYTEHPDFVMSEPTRDQLCGRGGTQCVLDLANPAVVSNLHDQLHAIWQLPGLAYIKWDANANIFNQGSPYLGRDRQANCWFDYTVGLYSLLSRLVKEHPDTIIQACSSGGGRMDYGFLKYADEFWVSDVTDARERVFMQWGASQFYPACAQACHVTASPSHQTGRVTPLKYRFDVACAGRLGFELHPKDMTSDEIAFAKQCVADYKRLRKVIQQGDLYRLVSPYNDSTYASLMYVAPDKAKSVVFIWGLNRGPNREYPALIRLAGLDPEGRYLVREINRLPDSNPHVAADGKTIGGDVLMNFGLEPILSNGDYDSCVLELTVKSNT